MSNLPQTLEERTRFVLDALLATGITAPWMSAFAASPERFRDFLRAHRKMASMHIHPDVLAGDEPEIKALRELASPYLTAVDSLLLLGDEELPNALQKFADRYGTGRSELLDKLQELISERRLVQEKAIRDAEQLQRERATLAQEAKEIEQKWGSFYAGHLPEYAPYPLPTVGERITVAHLAGRYVASPLEEDFYTTKKGRHLGYVTPEGDLYTRWWEGDGTASELREQARLLLFSKTGKPVARDNRGRVTAFTQTQALEEESTMDALFSRGASPGEITFAAIPLQKIVRALSGKLRQDEKWNKKSSTEGARDKEWSVRRPVLVAMKPELEATQDREVPHYPPHVFTLTLFPLAILLPENGNTSGD